MTTKKEALKTPEKEIAVISRQVCTIEEKAKAVTVTSQEDVETATVFLSEVKAQADRVEAGRKFFVDPLNEQVKKINAMFKEQSAPLVAAISTVKTAVSTYLRAEEQKARDEEARLLKIRQAADAKREEKGKAPILAPVKSVERAAPTVFTSAGRSTQRKVWTFEITDPAALWKNRKFAQAVKTLAIAKELDQQVLRNMVKQGERDLPGVRIYQDIDIAVSATK